ncbi:hypothetical protein Rhopal_006133-T1 [Rhodotorula paludigena]|uniref:Uncharacterized protein n=1 Tax=Rhodotorula paludigena TaxID=86838 RepID=A0AAV5GS74_9BASI|nr:hypothetical protein Rhopal_006133-T1 [Rhodotorula paludigena]
MSEADLERIYQGELVFHDPPSQSNHRPWPKLIPPNLAPRLASAAEKRARLHWTEELNELHRLLPLAEWNYLFEDHQRDEAAWYDSGTLPCSNEGLPRTGHINSCVASFVASLSAVANSALFVIPSHPEHDEYLRPRLLV